MKPLLLIVLCSANIWCGRSISKKAFENLPTIQEPVEFSSRVQPILQKNCSPCHFPGGKMYAKLPFDPDSTIIKHEAGILKRIKDEEENTIIRNFIKQNNK